MQTALLKYLSGLAVVGILVSFLYYLYVRSPQANNPIDDIDSTLDSIEQNLPEFDFYKFLPESEEVIDSLPPTRPSEQGQLDDTSDIVFQVGAYRDKREANRRRAELILLNLPARVELTEINGQNWHRLRIGPVDKDQFDKIQNRLSENNIDFFLTKPKPP